MQCHSASVECLYEAMDGKPSVADVKTALDRVLAGEVDPGSDEQLKLDELPPPVHPKDDDVDAEADMDDEEESSDAVSSNAGCSLSSSSSHKKKKDKKNKKKDKKEKQHDKKGSKKDEKQIEKQKNKQPEDARASTDKAALDTAPVGGAKKKARCEKAASAAAKVQPKGTHAACLSVEFSVASCKL